MFARTKKYIDDHMLEVSGGVVVIGAVLATVAITRYASMIGAQEGARAVARISVGVKDQPIQIYIDDSKVAADIIKSMKAIKQAGKAAKIATENI